MGDLGPLSLGESGASVRTGDGVLFRIRSGAVGSRTGDPHRTTNQTNHKWWKMTY